MSLSYGGPKNAWGEGKGARGRGLDGKQKESDVQMGWRWQVILICTLRDFWDPDSRGGKNTNQRERKRKREKREVSG